MEDVSFVDDVTVMVVEEASKIIDKVCSATAIAVNTFGGFGMDLNFLPGNLNVPLNLWGWGKQGYSEYARKW